MSSTIQTFYDNMASQYDKLFMDWQASTREQAELLNTIFQNYGYGNNAKLLDCSCGIGTQAIGLALLGYDVTASDISDKELEEAKKRAAENKLLEEKPSYSAPYIHKTDKGQRVSFQTWDWMGDNYKFTQYIIDDEGEPQLCRFECEYRAVRRKELTEMLLKYGCREATWKMPEETGFYQPIVVARR